MIKQGDVESCRSESEGWDRPARGTEIVPISPSQETTIESHFQAHPKKNATNLQRCEKIKMAPTKHKTLVVTIIKIAKVIKIEPPEQKGVLNNHDATQCASWIAWCGVS